jgi:hypothetical protein
LNNPQQAKEQTNVSEQNNQRVVEEIYAAFGRGDVEFILNALADEFDWYFPQEGKIPWSGRRKSREEVGQFFTEIVSNADVELFEPQQFVAQGDQVVVFGRERLRLKATGKAYDADWAHKWTILDGKVVAWREYTDTAAVVEAVKV